MLKIPNLVKKAFIHGFIILTTLVIIQLLLDIFENSFLLYMPPLGFVFFLIVSYFVQPLIVGVLNVVAIHRLYNLEGWQIGFWLNGLFLLLVFSTINLVLQTVTRLPFSSYVAIAEIAILSYPFGYLGKFSNAGRKKSQTAASINGSCVDCKT